MKTSLRALWREFVFQIAPPVAVALGNRKIAEPNQVRQDQWRKMTREQLLKVISDEWDRAKSLDEKLTKTTAALSVISAIGGAAARPLLDGLAPSPFKLVVFVLVLFAIVSVFSGVVMGFAGLRPKARGGIGPDFAAATRTDSAIAKTACIDALAGFEVSNMRRSNEASGANAAIRNGITAFVLATLVGLFAPRAETPVSPAPPSAAAAVSIIVTSVDAAAPEPTSPSSGMTDSVQGTVSPTDTKPEPPR